MSGFRLWILVFLISASRASAQPADSSRTDHVFVPPVARVARTSDPIHVDGRLDESAWASAQPITNFTQVDPSEGKPASERTEVRILVDDEALYIGAKLFDLDPSGIRARLARRDDETDSDHFDVFLDSYHDHLTAWHFRVNPAGAIRDAAIYADGGEDDSWDAVWGAAASMNAEGWVAEMRIPLSQLHYADSPDAVWGIQLARVIQRLQEQDVFSFTAKKDQGGVRRYGDLVGLGQLSLSHHTELLPYMLGRSEFTHPGAGNPFRSGNDFFGDFGLDFKYSLTSNLTLSGTLNPDFGQAEVDPAVVNLSAFETFYPEKRPFFVADAGNLSFGSLRSMNNFGFGQTFYTRRIGRSPHLDVEGNYPYVDQPRQSTIAGAAKLTGKTSSGWTVGILDALTTRESARFLDEHGLPGREPVEPLTNYFLGRLRRDIHGGDSQVGILLSGVHRDLRDPVLRASLRSSAYATGFDWSHGWSNQDWSLDGFFLGSHVRGSESAIAATQRNSSHYYQRPDAPQVTYDPTRTSLSGYHGEVAFARNNGEHWIGSITTQFMSPGFDVNDLGFMGRADRFAVAPIVLYLENKPGKIFRNYQAFPFTYHAWNYDGKLITAGYAASFNGQFANYWGENLQVRYSPETYNDQLTRGGPISRAPESRQVTISLYSDTRKPWTAQADVNFFGNDAGGRTGSGGLSLSFRPSPALQLRIGPQYESDITRAQYLMKVSDVMATATSGSRYVFAQLRQKTLSLETRINWTLSPRASLQVYLQPLIATGAYADFKEFRTPGRFEFDVYGKDRGTIEQDSAGTYVVDPDGAGGAQPFDIANPDFNFRSLRGNAVLRWEYRPGSTVFFIWQQTRTDVGPDGDLDFHRDLSALAHSKADNTFMAKITRWFGW